MSGLDVFILVSGLVAASCSLLAASRTSPVPGEPWSLRGPRWLYISGFFWTIFVAAQVAGALA